MKTLTAIILIFSSVLSADDACNNNVINGSWLFSFNGKPTYQCMVTFNDFGGVSEKLCTQLPFGGVKAYGVIDGDKVEVIQDLDGCRLSGELILFKKTSGGSATGSVDEINFSKPFNIKYEGFISTSDSSVLGSFYRDYKEKTRPNGMREVVFSDGAAFSAIRTK